MGREHFYFLKLSVAPTLELKIKSTVKPNDSNFVLFYLIHQGKQHHFKQTALLTKNKPAGTLSFNTSVTRAMSKRTEKKTYSKTSTQKWGVNHINKDQNMWKQLQN